MGNLSVLEESQASERVCDNAKVRTSASAAQESRIRLAVYCVISLREAQCRVCACEKLDLPFDCLNIHLCTGGQNNGYFDPKSPSLIDS